VSQTDPRSSLEIARDAYDAFTQGDLDAVVGAFDADIVWEQAQGLPHGGTYVGVEAVKTNVFGPLDREWWDEFSATPEQFIAAGEEVVVLGRYRGIAKTTGNVLDVPFVHVWVIARGRVTRFRQFLDTAGWNTALGVSPPGAVTGEP